MLLEGRTPHWPGGQRLGPGGQFGKEKQNSDWNYFYFLYVSSRTEIKCKSLALSCQDLYVLHAQGMSFSHQQEEMNISGESPAP